MLKAYNTNNRAQSTLKGTNNNEVLKLLLEEINSNKIQQLKYNKLQPIRLNTNNRKLRIDSQPFKQFRFAKLKVNKTIDNEFEIHQKKLTFTTLQGWNRQSEAEL